MTDSILGFICFLKFIPKWHQFKDTPIPISWQTERQLGLPFPLAKDSACQLFCHTTETQTFSDSTMNTSNTNTFPCAWLENCTHMSPPCLTFYGISNLFPIYPWKHSSHATGVCNLLSAPTRSLYPGTGIVEVIRVSYQHSHLVNTTYLLSLYSSLFRWI